MIPTLPILSISFFFLLLAPAPQQLQDLHGSPLPAGAIGSFGTVRRWSDLYMRDLQTTCIAASPDGRVLASGNEKQVTLWDAETRQELRSLVPKNEVRSRVRALAFAPDSKSLATIDNLGILRVWNVGSGRERFTTKLGLWSQPKAGYAFVAFTVEGKLLVKVPYTQSLALLDPGSGRLLGSLKLEMREIHSAALAADGKTVALGTINEVGVYDITTGRRLALLPQPMATEALAFSPDCKRLAVKCGNQACVHDL